MAEEKIADSIGSFSQLKISDNKKKTEGQEMRSKAYALCRDYLHGAWQLIASDEMIFRPISGGLSNLLYFCELPSYQSPLGDEPSRVLLRMYGQVRDGAHDSTITESVIFTLLAERRLGPKLYGIFPGGRLEQYIQALPLSCSDLRDPQISTKIAERMAMVHSLEVPICKEPTFLWVTMKKWIQLSVACLSDETLADNPEKAAIIKALRLCDYEHEMEWIKDYIGGVCSPVMFCHNDCQEGNILRHDLGTSGRPPKLTLIDYEYCSYNYRGFDLANHFCEWMYDYSPPQYPFFAAFPSRWPSREQQLRYIRAYIKTRDGAAKEANTTPTKVRLSNGPEPQSGDAGSSEPNAEVETANGPVENGPESEPVTATATETATETETETETEKAETNGTGEQAEEEERLLEEVRVFTLASHLFWTLWSIVNAPVSTIPFGYWEYGLCRLRAYQDHKQMLLESDPRCPKVEQGVKRSAAELE
ncbi:Choline/ethanolamine kinase [Amphibalanus amphitrite]|uniref:Choline/ethanolamine kinase n=1 Tax=Amphibalanus amphitrite TaxID=1232801 RepID=A0A6A4V2E5_AMPAM|nr:Choline/ethanolamine kinase [Amphibalanus amphitrite]